MDIIPGWELDLLAHINKQYGSQFVQGDLEFTIADGSTEAAFRVNVKPAVGAKYYGEDYFIYHRRDPSKYFQGVPVSILLDGDTTLAVVIQQLADTYGIEFNTALDFTDDTLAQPVSFAGSGELNINIPVADTSFIWTGAFDLKVLSSQLDIGRIIQARDVSGLEYPTTKGKISLPLASMPVKFDAAAKAGAFNADTLSDAGATSVINDMVGYGTLPDSAATELHPALIGATVSVTASESDATAFTGFIGTIETDNYSGSIQLRYTHAKEEVLDGLAIWNKYGPLGATVAGTIGWSSLTQENMDSTVAMYKEMMGATWDVQERMIWESLASDAVTVVPTFAKNLVGMICVLTGNYTTDEEIDRVTALVTGVEDPDYDLFRKNTGKIVTTGGPSWMPAVLLASEERADLDYLHHPMPFLVQSSSMPASGIESFTVTSGPALDGAYLTQQMKGIGAPILTMIQGTVGAAAMSTTPVAAPDMTGATLINEFTANVKDVITPNTSGKIPKTAGGTVDIATYRQGSQLIQVFSNLKPVVTDKLKKIWDAPIYIQTTFNPGNYSTAKYVTQSKKMYPLLNTDLSPGNLVNAALLSLDGFELLGVDNPLAQGEVQYVGTKAGINDDLTLRGTPKYTEEKVQDFLARPLAYLLSTDAGNYGFDNPIEGNNFTRAIIDTWSVGLDPVSEMAGESIAGTLANTYGTFDHVKRPRPVVPYVNLATWYTQNHTWERTETTARLTTKIPKNIMLAAGTQLDSDVIDITWNLDVSGTVVRDLLQFPALTITADTTAVPNPSAAEGIWVNTNYVIGYAYRAGYDDAQSRFVYDWLTTHFTREERESFRNTDVVAPAITADQLINKVVNNNLTYYVPFSRDMLTVDVVSGFYKPTAGDNTPGKFIIILTIKDVVTADGSLAAYRDLLIGKVLHMSIDTAGTLDLGAIMEDAGNGYFYPAAADMEVKPLSNAQIYLFALQTGNWTEADGVFTLGQSGVNDINNILKVGDLKVTATLKA